MRPEDQHHFTQLGVLTHEFNLLEMVVHRFAWEALGFSNSSGKAITQNLSLDGVEQLLRRALQHDCVERADLTGPLEKLLQRLPSIRDRRNRFVHSIRFGDERILNLKDWLRPMRVPVASTFHPPDELGDLIVDIAALSRYLALSLGSVR